jgi:hypothetical protein
MGSWRCDLLGHALDVAIRVDDLASEDHYAHSTTVRIGRERRWQHLSERDANALEFSIANFAR